jgi:hypothetical protein
MKKVVFLASMLVCSAHGANERPEAPPVGPAAFPDVLDNVHGIPDAPPVAIPGFLERVCMGVKATGIEKIACYSGGAGVLSAALAYAARYMPFTPAQLQTPTFVALSGVIGAVATLCYQCLCNRVYVVREAGDVGTRRNIVIVDEIAPLGAARLAPNETLQNVWFAEGFNGAIAEDAFANCVALQSIKFSNRTTTIGASAFRECRSLEEVDVPSDIINIERGTFQSCIALREIHLSNNLQKIQSGAFYNCYALKQMTIPSDTISIQQYAFQACLLDKITLACSTITITSGPVSFIRAREIVFTQYNRDNKEELLAHFRPIIGEATARAEFRATGEHWECSSEQRWHKLEEETAAGND